MKRILFTISGHGLGHLGQMAPVVRALRASRPEVAITVRTGIDRRRVEERLGFPIDVIAAGDDFGVEIRDGFDIDLPATGRAYDRLYDRWPDVLGDACAGIAAARPDLIVANAGFVPLAAGAELGIPSVGLASLDWYTILGSYWAGERARMLRLMDGAYASALGLLAFAPATAEAGWRRTTVLGPAADPGRARGEALRDRLGVPRGHRLVLCAFGNSPPPRPRTDLLACPETVFLVPEAWGRAPAARAIDSLDWPFIDLLASCDACLTKLGYGVAAEAVRNGVPLLYHRRSGWREDAALVAWTEMHGRAMRIDLPTLDATRFRHALDEVSGQPLKPPIAFLDPESVVSLLVGV